jgi:serine/threonine-protein kinase RsbW
VPVAGILSAAVSAREASTCLRFSRQLFPLPMAEPAPNVRLNLLSTAENVVLVREMLSGLEKAIGINASDLNDIRTAVTEACNNVVQHAYAGGRGSLELEIRMTPGTLEVLVRDQGRGMQTKPEPTNATTQGIGMHVIQTLTHAVEFMDGSSGGTEVRMTFSILDAREPKRAHRDSPAIPTIARTQSPTTAILSVAPINLAQGILPRIVSALAARAHFSTDRICDAQLVADALVAHAHGSMSGDHLSVEVSVEPRELELRVAPLQIGRAKRLIDDSEVEGLGSVIEKLADHHGVTMAGSYETLTVGLVDRH